VAVSTSAPLIRYAAAPALAIAFWRNALALPVVGALVAARHRREWRALSRREWYLCAVSGGFLAAHFATWVPSLSYTSVASSVALVATQPVWAAVIARARGEAVPAGAWAGIGIAVAGVVVLTGIDVSISGRALFGDLLALAGGVLAAAYVTVGAAVRQTVSTASYATASYAVAGLLLLVVCVGAGLPLGGYSAGTWWALAALVLGPQLLGHTLVNRVLRTISPTIVSVAILFEVVGASVLAWLWFGELPPPAALPAAVLILGGVVKVIRSLAAPAVVTPAVD
jgi:drug/metabolite transporter (DMT)-like permease